MDEEFAVITIEAINGPNTGQSVSVMVELDDGGSESEAVAALAHMVLNASTNGCAIGCVTPGRTHIVIGAEYMRRNILAVHQSNS